MRGLVLILSNLRANLNHWHINLSPLAYQYVIKALKISGNL
jgi:hypothetical protein